MKRIIAIFFVLLINQSVLASSKDKLVIENDTWAVTFNKVKTIYSLRQGNSVIYPQKGYKFVFLKYSAKNKTDKPVMFRNYQIVIKYHERGDDKYKSVIMFTAMKTAFHDPLRELVEPGKSTDQDILIMIPSGINEADLIVHNVGSKNIKTKYIKPESYDGSDE